MNEVCYEKVCWIRRASNIVFVHSWKETAKTAKFLRYQANEKETVAQFDMPESAVRDILAEEVKNVKDPNLEDLLPLGFAFHTRA